MTEKETGFLDLVHDLKEEALGETTDWVEKASKDTYEWTKETVEETVEFVQELPNFDVSAVDVSVNSYHVEQTVVIEDPLAVPPTDSELEQNAHDATAVG